MNLAMLQDAAMQEYPTVVDVIEGRHVVTTPTVVLLRRTPSTWEALGPYPTADVEWHRLPKTVRVFVEP